jgi:hypothetical protein
MPATDRLIETSTAYVKARFAFEEAIHSARRDGLSDEQIAHLLGFSLAMVEAVAGRRRGGAR